MANPFDQFDAPQDSNPFDQFDPKPAAKPSSLARRALGDTAVSLGKGIVGAGESAVGLADLATGGRAGKALSNLTGYDPKATKAALDELYSPEQKAANKAVQEADGFMPTLGALAKNPSAIVQGVAESAPSIIGAGGGAQMLGKAGILAKNALARGALGEGLVGAGQQAEQFRQDNPDGTLSARQEIASLASGAGTAAFAGLGGKVAQKLGIADLDTMLAGGGAPAAAAKQGLARRIGEGFVSEGALEEMPQSIWEQGAQNFGNGKALSEGMGSAAATGLVVGGVMGGGANVTAHQPKAAPAPAEQAAAPAAAPDGAIPYEPTTVADVAKQRAEEMGINPENGPLSAAASMAVESGAAAIPGFSPEQAQSMQAGEIRDAAQQAIAEGQYEADRRRAEQEARAAAEPGMPFERIAPEDYDTLNPIKAGQGELVEDPVRRLPAPESRRALPQNSSRAPALGFTPQAPEPMRATADGQVGTAQQMEGTRAQRQQAAVEQVRTLMQGGATLQGRNLVDSKGTVIYPNLNIQQYREARQILANSTQEGGSKVAASQPQEAPQNGNARSATDEVPQGSPARGGVDARGVVDLRTDGRGGAGRPDDRAVSGQAAAGVPGAGVGGAGRVKRRGGVVVTDERLQHHADALASMAQDAGWQEQGGRIIRDGNGNVAGRTKWLPRAEWFQAGMQADPQALAESVRKARAGEAIPSKDQRTISAMMDYLDAQEQGRPLDEDSSAAEWERIGYNEASAQEQAAFDAIDELLDATPLKEADAMRALGFTEDEIRAEIEASSRQGRAGETQASRAQERAADDRAGARDEAGGDFLQSYSEQDLANRAEAERQAEERRAKDDKQAEDKARADSERDTFTLTGSDRPADVLAAQGQGGLFDRPLPASPETTDRITPKVAATLGRGDIFRDKFGAEFYVWSSRFGHAGTIEAVPYRDGKPVVYSGSSIRFSLNDAAREANPERRSDPIFLVSRTSNQAQSSRPDSGPEAETEEANQEPAKKAEPAAKVVSPDEFPTKEADASYSHISHMGSTRAAADRDAFVSTIQGIYNVNLPAARTDAQKAALLDAVDKAKREYLEENKRLMQVRSGTYSGFVAGGAKLNAKQANRGNAALDRALERFAAMRDGLAHDVARAVRNARTPEEVATEAAATSKEKADKAAAQQAKNDAFLSRLIDFKAGDDLVIGQTKVVRVNMDREGLPASISFNDGYDPVKLVGPRAAYKTKDDLRAAVARINDAKAAEQSDKREANQEPVKKAKPTSSAGAGDLFAQAKAAGVKGLRANMSDDAIKAKLKSRLSGERAAKYIREGKKSGLPQYVSVSESEARKFAETISQYPYSIDTRNWVFDARGVLGAEGFVSGGLLAEGDDKYKHKLSVVGKELAHEVLANPVSIAGSRATGNAPSPLESLFSDLDSTSTRKANKAKKAAAKLPQADRIQHVQANFHDILIAAMDAGNLEVNGVRSLTEETQQCL